MTTDLQQLKGTLPAEFTLVVLSVPGGRRQGHYKNSFSIVADTGTGAPGSQTLIELVDADAPKGTLETRLQAISEALGAPIAPHN